LAPDDVRRAWLQVARRDLARLAVHWTKAAGGGGGFFGDREPRREAVGVLERILILEEATLRGGNGFIRGGHTCVCFTEAPLVEMVSVFASVTLAGQALRYEPYGIGVSKEWLFQLGGRPVIYQPDGDYDRLPDDFRWRHCRFDPPDIDFTWEREWRIPAARIGLDRAQTWVFVPTDDTARQLADQRPGWRVVSLELFGLPSPGDVHHRREA